MRHMPKLRISIFQIHPLLLMGATALMLDFLLLHLLAFLDPWTLGAGSNLVLANAVTASITAGVLFILAAASVALYVAGWIFLMLGLLLSVLSPFAARFQQSLAE